MNEYRVPHTPHVVGTYPNRVWDRDLGKHEPQQVDIKCELCGATWRVQCEQGRPREHVHTFARDHLHHDPFKRPA